MEATIQRAVEESEERLMEQGRAAMEYADAHFTLEAFTGQMRTVLEKMFQSPVTNSWNNRMHAERAFYCLLANVENITQKKEKGTGKNSSW